MLDHLKRAREWATNEAIDEDSRKEIADLLSKGQEKEVEERFYRDLEFGTGGMRAPLGAGTNRLNRYNVRRASVALALALGEEGKVAISYDSRRCSFEFAKETSATLAACNIKALVFKAMSPIALISFAIRHHGCSAGVMITASHNPPEYNGYKVFGPDGAQVTPPFDEKIIEHFRRLSDYGVLKTADFDESEQAGIIKWIGEETWDAYFAAIKPLSLAKDLCRQRGDEIKIVYSALHGSGEAFCLRALKEAGLTNILSVPEQAAPNENFPTVQSPNPENPAALKMSVELMKKEGADLVMATDPDTDRVGVALLHKGEVVYPNGNQLGTIMLHYVLSRLQEADDLPSQGYIVKTIVTTPLQETIAADFNVAVENTLTGFKWICRRVKEIEEESPKRDFLFAAEESFGYLNHLFSRDKDGVSACALLGEVALFYKSRGMTLIDAIEEIYRKYGASADLLLNLSYYGKEGSEKIRRIMEHFRKWNNDILGGFTIAKMLDYSKGGDNMPPSDVLGFHFKEGGRLYLRPSGTEPKIKFYIMLANTEQTKQMAEFLKHQVEPL